MSDENTLKTFVSEHPRLLGILFTVLLLLSQAGTVAAGSTGVVTGP